MPLTEGVAASYISLEPDSLTALQPVAAAVVTSAKGVLITKRRDGVPPWGFPAGEVESGENPKDAAWRELKEECGIEVQVGQAIGQRVHPVTGRAMVYLSAKPVSSTKVFVGDESELSQVKWASLSEAERLMPDMFGPVHDYLQHVLGQHGEQP